MMTIQEWAKAKEGKPINEWPPLPDDITHVVYPQGLVIINKKAFSQNLYDTAEYYAQGLCQRYRTSKHCPILDIFKEV